MATQLQSRLELGRILVLACYYDVGTATMKRISGPVMCEKVFSVRQWLVAHNEVINQRNALCVIGKGETIENQWGSEQ